MSSAVAQPQSPESGWVWWAEKDDLVVGLHESGSAEAIIATLDGKKPSAVEHERVKELAKADGTFEPVCFGFARPGRGLGKRKPELSACLTRLKAKWGVDRLELRWGFEGDALLSVVRLVAAKPRKGPLATFDGPTFSKTTLLPMPDQIDSFLATSISTRHLVDADQADGHWSAVKDQIDEIAESLKTAGSIDLENDLLAHLGPRIVAYLAPGRSAATNDNSLESALSGGWSPTAAIAALQSAFPKLTLVAEVKNPDGIQQGARRRHRGAQQRAQGPGDRKSPGRAQGGRKERCAPTGRGGGRLGAGGGDRSNRAGQSSKRPHPGSR